MKRFLFLIGFILLVLGSAGFVAREIFRPVYVEPKTVTIPYGTPVPKIAEILEREEVLKSRWLFLLLHALMRKKLEAGEYEFKGFLSVYDVYGKLARGETKLYRITVKEGDDVYDIALALQRAGITRAEDFLRFATSPETPKRYGLDVPTMEGFLFPDTYFFSKNTHPLKVIDVMYKNFLKKTENLRKELKRKNIPLEVWVSVASMVEKETFLEEEKPLISAVIYNRLKKGMKLQIDPTVIYSAKRRGLWRGKLLKRFYKLDDPYNTYMYYGLPPGPISNPGLGSLIASLRPARVDYLYFVADKEGKGHLFATTYEEHLTNMRKAGRKD
ncbi:MAG: endolytic transglycosylase MltG [Aquificae bacterium]|nr:endolytic transglycosylase MltG [Aquificota bacterium]